MINKLITRPLYLCCAIVGLSVLLALATLFIGKATGMLASERHHLCLEIDSTSDGITQLFRSSTAGQFSEQQSQILPIIQGAQRVCFESNLNETFLRWDPNDVMSSMNVKYAEIDFRGYKQSISLKKFVPGSGVTSAPLSVSAVDWVFDNTDPQVYLQVDSTILLKEIIYCGILLTLSYGLAIVLCGFILIKLFIDKSLPYRMSAFTAVLLIAVYQVTGMIAVGNGAGWDGGAYLNLIFDWKNSGYMPDNDPYRVSRLSAFLPAASAAFVFDLTRDEVLRVQMVFNIFATSISMGLFVDYLMKSQIASRSVMLYAILLLLTWPILVMPTYYPLLSDHLAITLSCVCLWLFAHKRLKSCYWPA